MMAFLARAITGITGSSLTMPALVVTAIVLAHQIVKSHDNEQKAVGKAQCDADWVIATTQNERDAAIESAARAQEMLKQERGLMEKLRDDLQRTHEKYASYRPSDDPSCLSDSVLDLLRRNGAAKP
jgi:ABC-type transporter Mla subunit MlaD